MLFLELKPKNHGNRGFMIFREPQNVKICLYAVQKFIAKIKLSAFKIDRKIIREQ